MTHTHSPHSTIPRGLCIVLVYPSRPFHYKRQKKETVAPLGIISCVTWLYWPVNRAYLGKRTLSLPRLLCSLDVILVVTFPPFWFWSCSVVSTFHVDWRNFSFHIRLPNGDIFFIPWCNKIEPSSLSWKVEQDTKFACSRTHFLLPVFPGCPGWKIASRYVSDTCEGANSISIRLRACGRGHLWIRKEKYPDTCGRGLGEKSVVLSLSQNYINLPGFPCWMQAEKGPWIQAFEVDYF